MTLASLVRLTLAAVAALAAPAASRADTIYASDTGHNRIEKFTSGDVGSVFANNSGLFGPTYIAIQPGLVVPEPSAWAMLALCIPALLAIRPRKERQR